MEELKGTDSPRLHAQDLEAETASMRMVVLRMAEARMCGDAATMIDMIESCPHRSLKRGEECGNAGEHGEDGAVSQAGWLGY